VVTGAYASGGYPAISQNGWIDINGTDLAPLSVPASGSDWGAAREFANGRMPEQLGGVSVTINGKPAFIYYVSPTQVNVLAPLDDTLGTAQIVVTSGGLSSVPFSATKQAVSPAFPLYNGNQVVATHADFTLIGPTSAARPGETIILFAFGFGLPATALVNGSSTQAGPLPVLPQIEIGGKSATVEYAGVIGPGLYQFNVVVPATAADGDNTVACTYNNANSPLIGTIAIQH
jgi:uncharacterized protein (TIGR03437 family)